MQLSINRPAGWSHEITSAPAAVHSQPPHARLPFAQAAPPPLLQPALPHCPPAQNNISALDKEDQVSCGSSQSWGSFVGIEAAERRAAALPAQQHSRFRGACVHPSPRLHSAAPKPPAPAPCNSCMTAWPTLTLPDPLAASADQVPDGRCGGQGGQHCGAGMPLLLEHRLGTGSRSFSAGWPAQPKLPHPSPQGKRELEKTGQA